MLKEAEKLNKVRNEIESSMSDHENSQICSLYEDTYTPSLLKTKQLTCLCIQINNTVVSSNHTHIKLKKSKTKNMNSKPYRFRKCNFVKV